VLNEIKSNESKEIKVSIRQFKLHQNDVDPYPQYICEVSNINLNDQPYIKVKLAKLDSIKETYYGDDDTFKPTFSLQQMEQRVTNASTTKQQ
jgi:hypothetical protein